jgi:hypothetical protein
MSYRNLEQVQYFFYFNFICTSHLYLSILDSIVVSIPACHAGDRGSIHRRGDSFLICFSSICCFGIPYHTSSLILGIRLAAIKKKMFLNSLALLLTSGSLPTVRHQLTGGMQAVGRETAKYSVYTKWPF